MTETIAVVDRPEAQAGPSPSLLMVIPGDAVGGTKDVVVRHWTDGACRACRRCPECVAVPAREGEMVCVLAVDGEVLLNPSLADLGAG